jgi:hypothetical protein
MTPRTRAGAPGADSLPEYQDVTIVDLDLSRTTWSRVHSAMRTVFFRLSREPEVGWTRYFLEERASRVGLRRHGLWIEDGYVLVDCMIDDLETHHLPDIRQSLAHANKKMRELLHSRRAERHQSRKEAREEQELLTGLRERVLETAERQAAKPHATPPGRKTPAPKADTIEDQLELRRNEMRERLRSALRKRQRGR